MARRGDRRPEIRSIKSETGHATQRAGMIAAIERDYERSISVLDAWLLELSKRDLEASVRLAAERDVEFARAAIASMTAQPIDVIRGTHERCEKLGFAQAALRLAATLAFCQDLRYAGHRAEAEQRCEDLRAWLVRDRRLRQLRRLFLADVEALAAAVRSPRP